MTRWGAFRGKGGTKYGNVPRRCLQNHLHQSTRESKRCNELTALQAGGLIRDLQQQPRFKLSFNGVEIGEYRGDWAYYEGDEYVVEDSKSGVRTREYILKSRLMLACHGIRVRETR